MGSLSDRATMTRQPPGRPIAELSDDRAIGLAQTPPQISPLLPLHAKVHAVLVP